MVSTVRLVLDFSCATLAKSLPGPVADPWLTLITKQQGYVLTYIVIKDKGVAHLCCLWSSPPEYINTNKNCSILG